jgi:NDP-sugar pyrophosphorylase family protein
MPRRLAFTGVHVASPGLFDRIIEDGPFSIIDCYLRLAGEGASIRGADVGDAEWFEIGTPERLAAARERFA